MDKYESYFDFSFRDKLKIRNYERKNKVKCYATNSIDDMLDNLNKVKYGVRDEIEIYLPTQLRILPMEKIHTEIIHCNLFKDLKIPFLDFSYNYDHFMGEFSNFPFENQREMGIDILVYSRLIEISEKTGFSYVKNGIFKHFKNHKYPQLINFDLNFPKKRIKTDSKKSSLNLDLALGY